MGQNNFNLADYETVEERLRRFKGDHPSSQVITELVENTGNIGKTRWIVKASIWKDREGDRPDSTGYAFEVDGIGGFANTTSALENCETSAIGRALANLNYNGNKRVTREEMAKVQRMNQERADYVTTQSQHITEAEKAGNLGALEQALAHYRGQSDDQLVKITEDTIARVKNAAQPAAPAPEPSEEERKRDIAQFAGELISREEAGQFEDIKSAHAHYSSGKYRDQVKAKMARETLDRMEKAAKRQPAKAPSEEGGQPQEMTDAVAVVEGELVQ